MDDAKSKDAARNVTHEPARADRRDFLGNVAKAAGTLLLGDMVGGIPTAVAQQSGAPAVVTRKFTEWGWPLPYEQVSAKSKQWLQGKGWWPLGAAWIVVWSGEEMVGHVMQTQKLLEKRGIDTDWKTFVAAGFSNEAFIPGRIQMANTGALGVLALLSNKVPMRAMAVHSPALTHAATVPLDSPLKSLSDLKGARVLKRPAVVGTTTGSTNHFGFIAAAQYLGLKQNEDYTLRSSPPGDLATAPKGIDVYTIWEPHVSYSTDVLKVSRLLEPLDPYYIYSGYCYGRKEIEDNAPDVMQLINDAFMESVLWSQANPDEAINSLMSRPEYGRLGKALITKMSQRYLFWPKPTVYYPFDDPNGIWPKEEARISKWAYETGASKNDITNVEWQKARNTHYMDATYDKLGWAMPKHPAFLPKDFGGVGNLPYKPYGAALLNGPAPFPEAGELTKPWTFKGKTYHP
ncbi:MAG TPA: glycine betaine ABC transporter substrate-binding protein [Casimicrobiaceae bacterium]|nr:glycine betaine ABC transporter substrate-binding protein [Casimicrobiaceae bacterium]